jgi:hypothetical protein
MWNDLANTSNGLPRVLQPGYSVMNLRIGLDQTEGQWMTELYITNLTNKNAVIYTNEGNFDLRSTRNEPGCSTRGCRTAGASGARAPAASKSVGLKTHSTLGGGHGARQRRTMPRDRIRSSRDEPIWISKNSRRCGVATPMPAPFR